MLNLKIGDKLIVGLETTGLKMKANFDSMLLKVDEGNEVDEFIDYDTDLSFAGRTIERDTTESATHEDFETIREALADGDEVSFVYGRFTAGEKIVTGTATIREWSEDAGSQKQLGNWSGSLHAKKGTVGFTTYSA